MESAYRNALLFGYGLFPGDMICVAEQDITKFEASIVAPRPRPGAMQCTGWRGQNRYQPYERREARGAPQSPVVAVYKRRGQKQRKGWCH